MTGRQRRTTSRSAARWARTSARRAGASTRRVGSAPTPCSVVLERLLTGATGGPSAASRSWAETYSRAGGLGAGGLARPSPAPRSARAPRRGDSGDGRGRRRRYVHRRHPQRGRLVQPVPRHRGRVLRDVGADLRLHDHVLDGGHVARARPGDESWETSRGRPDLDLRHPRGRRCGPTASRSPPTTSPSPTAGSSTAARGRRHWGSYLTSVTVAEAPDDTTVVLTLEKPNAGPAAAADPDRARAHLVKDIDEKAVKTYQAEPDRRPAAWSAPARSGSVEGTAGGSTYRFERNPDYWQGDGRTSTRSSSGSTRPRTRWSRR